MNISIVCTGPRERAAGHVVETALDWWPPGVVVPGHTEHVSMGVSHRRSGASSPSAATSFSPPYSHPAQVMLDD